MSEVISGIVAIVSVIAAAGSFIITIVKHYDSKKMDNDQKYVELFESFEREIIEILRRGVDMNIFSLLKEIPEKEKDCYLFDYYDRYCSDYLNVLERISSLRKLERIDKNLIKHFERYFSYARKLANWKEEMNDENLYLEKVYPGFYAWLSEAKEETHEKYGRTLPTTMKKMLEKKQKS